MTLHRYSYMPYGVGDTVRERAGRHLARVEAIANGFTKVRWRGTRWISTWPIDDFVLVAKYQPTEVPTIHAQRPATVRPSPRAQLESYWAESASESVLQDYRAGNVTVIRAGKQGR